ncbi:T9SS type A sorting domain-containing protein [Polaribacter sp. L3A8]|uniref:T9SS type A sorting domain-containing protein n=1 Tax=Polaribacter sp. L3A8 TaxID=2686361 RepID=UPI00131E1CE6|nr:T9SS type A sorting domain-containing protein [Polaribacter sp. L3A8]
MKKTTFQVCEFGEIQRLLKNKTKSTLLLVALLFTSSFIVNAQVVPADTNDNISFYKKFSGANLTYKQIGNSEIKYNINSTDFSICAKNNGAATSANLALPADAVIKAAYIQWFALVKHGRTNPNITSYAPLKTSIPVTFPNGTKKTINKIKSYRESVPFIGLNLKYEGYLADITADVLALSNPAGTYTADIILTNDYDALKGACAYAQENVRAWQMVVVYESPTDESGINQVYLYDGLKGFLGETIKIPVDGYKVHSGDTAGSISVASLQGSPNLNGEFINSSDAAFGSFPPDFANSGGVSNPAPGTNASAGSPYGGWDIDVVNSHFTPGTTSLELSAGSTGDLILFDLFVLKIPTGGLVVNKKTTTPNVNIGENGTYEITLKNVTDVDLKGITAKDILPPGFTYATTANIVLDKATQTATTTPSIGDTTLNWGTFDINGKGSVTIIFDINVPENEPLGTYSNAATATVSSPSDTVITNYDGSGSNDDITVGNRCDAKSSGNLDTDGDGISDICDLDDDNDGILDVDENICGNSGTPLLYEDFGVGNATTSSPLSGGITTNYTYLELNNPFSSNLEDDFYAVFNNIPTSASWANEKWQTIGDHTSGSLTPTRDNMLMVNAGQTLDVIYQKTITGVAAGAHLDVSFWVLNLDVDNVINNVPQRVLPNIQIELWQNGALLGPAVNTGNIVRKAAGSSTAWRYYKTIAPLITLNSSNITVVIRNNTKATDGNDLAIDDIIVRQLCNTDSDGDGIPNSLDLDSDNDGIPDVIETGGVDENNDGMADGEVGNTKSTNGIPSSAGTGNSLISTDSDGVPDYIDIDADNDGIPDNIEVQTTADYIAPSGVGTAMADSNNNGIDDRYEAGDKVFIPVDTDGDKIPDYLDSDSDNDGILDIAENGDPQNVLTGIDTDGDGLDNAFDDNTDNPNTGFTVNDGVSPNNKVTNLTTLENSFGDEDNDFNPSNPATGNLDYRDIRDNDKDGIADSIDLDDDNDGIPDTVENGGNIAEGDEDGDGIPNYLDTNDNGNGDGSTTNYTDADGNGIPDVYDTDGDGVPNHFDLDSDNDGIPDIVEAGGIDTDGNGKVDDINSNGTLVNDKDKDGLDDRYDANVTGGTNGNAITNPDSDGDGIPDTQDLDSDNDGIPDIVEAGGTDTNGDGIADNINPNGSLKNDIDNDGFDDLVDGDVGQLGTPNNKDNALIITGSTDANNDGKPDTYTTGDTDGDGIPNHIDLDSDNDGITDITEAGGIDANGDGKIDDINTNGTLKNDADNDGFDDAVDGNVNGTNNQNNALIVTGTDTDGDGKPNTYPNGDTDKDNVLDFLDLDSDNDGVPDIIEAGGIDSDGNGKVDDINSNGTLINDKDKDGLDDRYDTNVTGGTNGNAITNPDTDGDGIKDTQDLDSDNDGIPDVVEAGGTDTDGNGIADTFTDIDGDGFNDYVDGDVNGAINIDKALIITGSTDSNNDGKPDTYTTGDKDGDGIPNYVDLDSDNDGIPDLVEAGGIDTDGNGLVDNINNTNGKLINDVDNDGFDDAVDGNVNGTNNQAKALITTGSDTNNNGRPNTYPNGDTDNDGILDSLDLDADNDGIPDLIEAGGIDTDGNGIVDNVGSNGKLINDTDNDGFDDAVDGQVVGTSNDKDNALVVTGTDTDSDGKPNSYNTADSDKDGIPNHLDLDSDNDGIVDIIEAGGTDANRDGKTDNINANDKLLADTDNDGYDDNIQNTPLLITGSDTDSDGKPNSYVKGDADNDGKPNFLDIDADDDGIPDNIEGQTTVGYKKPSGTGNGIIDNNNNGVDDAYESGSNIGLIPENTDGDTGANYVPDYLDTDADNDGVLDIAENGDPQNVLQMDGGKLKDTDGDGLNDAFDDNVDNSNNGFTVNDGLSPNNKVENLLALKNSFGDVDDDFDPNNPATGNLDYRDVPSAADAMITQVYQFGSERWIEVTNIGITDIPANTIKVQLYKDKTISQIDALASVKPNAEGIVNSVLKAGKSVLFKNNITSSITNLGTTNIITNKDLTDFIGGNDVITLSSASDVYSWTNRYDVASSIENNTSVVRIDQTLVPNSTYTESEWVVFIDDAIHTYQSGYGSGDSSPKRHSQAPLISEIENSNTEANTLLGLHRIKETTTNSDGTWDNGFPDRSRYVVIDENYNHSGSKLSARKLDVISAKELRIIDNLLVVTNSILLNGDIRLTGETSQLIQTHTNASEVSGKGKLFVDQNSQVDSKYRYNYMSSPVTTVNKDTYSLSTVLKDGTTPNNPKDITFVTGYDGSITSTGISLADYWVYTYAAGSNGRSNWLHKYRSGEINRGDGYTFKGPGREQNYTFAGTPNDGLFNTSYEISAGQSYLIGNPFPSALNARKFIDDNNSIISTLYFWQHVAENNATGTIGHNFGGYIGGYATQNITMATAANFGKGQPTNNTLEAEDASQLNGGIILPIGLGTGKYEVSLNLNDQISFSNVPNGVDSLRIIYRAVGSKNLKIKINNIERGEFTFPTTVSGLFVPYNEIKFAMCIEPGSEVTLTSSSNSINPIFIDKIILKDQDGQIACTSNTGGPEYANKFKTPEPYIAIAQGFFVIGHNTGKILFNNSQREYKTEGEGNSIFLKSEKKVSKTKTSSSELPILKLGMNYSNTIGSSLHRQIGVSFSKETSFAYENGYDAQMYDVNPTDFYWKFPNDANSYVITGVQEISDDLEVPLEIVVSKNSVISIVLDEISNINRDVFIKDKLKGKTHKINNASATYQLKAGTYTDRFVLAFVAADSALDLEDDILAKQTTVYADNDNHNIVISKNQEVNINNVELYDILGKKVILWNIKEQKETYQLEIRKQIPTGIYIVKMNTDKGTINKKVVIE